MAIDRAFHDRAGEPGFDAGASMAPRLEWRRAGAWHRIFEVTVGDVRF